MGPKEAITAPGHLTLPPAPPSPALAPTPLSWRFVIAAVVVSLAVAASTAQTFFGRGDSVLRAQAGMGVVAFIGVVALFSSNLRAINYRTIGWGFALQVLLALFVLKFEVFGCKPCYALFNVLASVAKKFLEFTH